MRDTAHEPQYLKVIGKHVCAACGLIYLRNEATEKAIRAPCKGKVYENTHHK